MKEQVQRPTSNEKSVQRSMFNVQPAVIARPTLSRGNLRRSREAVEDGGFRVESLKRAFNSQLSTRFLLQTSNCKQSQSALIPMIYRDEGQRDHKFKVQGSEFKVFPTANFKLQTRLSAPPEIATSLSQSSPLLAMT